MPPDDQPVKRRRKRDDGEDRLVKPNEHRPEQPARDASGKWRREVDKMTVRLGWHEGFLWHWFCQIATCIEFEQRLDRRNAEHAGFRLLRGMFDKTEVGADVQ